MIPYALIALVLSLCLFAIAAFWNPPPEPHWYKLVAAGLFFLTLSMLFGAHR